MFKMTEEEYREHCEDSNGMCIGCHAVAECCEPDACGYTCDECGADDVYGMEELLLMGLITFTEDN